MSHKLWRTAPVERKWYLKFSKKHKLVLFELKKWWERYKIVLELLGKSKIVLCNLTLFHSCSMMILVSLVASQYCMQIYLLKLSCFILICLFNYNWNSADCYFLWTSMRWPKTKGLIKYDLIRRQNADSRECNLLIFQTEQEIQATFTIKETGKRKMFFF